MRAALTVRRKQKEDLKEALAGHLDALWDMVGQSAALDLISTKILLFPAVFAFAVGETKFLLSKSYCSHEANFHMPSHFALYCWSQS